MWQHTSIFPVSCSGGNQASNGLIQTHVRLVARSNKIAWQMCESGSNGATSLLPQRKLTDGSERDVLRVIRHLAPNTVLHQAYGGQVPPDASNRIKKGQRHGKMWVCENSEDVHIVV